MIQSNHLNDFTWDFHKTFSKFKQDFYTAIGNGKIFDTKNFNALKIVLDGLKVNYAKRYPTKLYLDNIFGYYFIYFLKSIKHFNRSIFNTTIPLKDIEILLFTNDIRTVQIQNTIQSFLFTKIYETIDVAPQKILCLLPTVPDNFNQFQCLSYYSLSYLRYNAFTPQSALMRNQMVSLLSKIRATNIFSPLDIQNISIAFQNFLEHYNLYSYLLNRLPSLKLIIMKQHYHNEALIYVAKQKNIPVIELQHGIISTNDIFYVFPEQVKDVLKNALFPDEIFVFGNYWKKILLNGYEFAPENIHVVGDFISRVPPSTNPDNQEVKQILEWKQNSPIVLICTQTFMHEFYISYITKLAQLLNSQYPSWKIIVKIHPNEKKEIYLQSLSTLSNVMITNYFNLDFLFSISAIHISVYSTTLFEALKYPHLKNLTIECHYANDYRNELIFNKIAYPISENDNPIVASFNYPLTPYNELYAPFNSQIVKSILQKYLN